MKQQISPEVQRADNLVIVDFESEAIEARPDYPPKPVGVSILKDGVAKYYAWSHPTGNNCTYEEAHAALSEVWESDATLVFHNAQFDISVAIEKMGMSVLPWYRVHDTMILAFLHNPHEESLALKDLADKLCGMAPVERDEVREWVLAHVEGASKAKTKWGAHISKVPGDIVGRYADGDTTRTLELFEYLYPRIVKMDMKEAYEREMRLMPILMENSRLGIPVDVETLGKDIATYRDILVQVDDWIIKRLEVFNPEFNLDSDEQLAEVLSARGLVTDWVLTEKGKRSTSADALDKTLSDRELFGALQYRGALSTCVNTFMQNWFNVAEKTGGTIYTAWNQTRGVGIGARTGRLSSHPNMQNIPTALDGVNALRPEWCPELPKLRSYIIAPKGWRLIARDYSAQELRVFAHYESDKLAEKYTAEPMADIHQFVAEMITTMGVKVSRQTAKTLNFLTLYGGGVGKLASQLNISVEQAQEIKNAYLAVFPALKEINSLMRTRGRKDEPIRTLGGRLYKAEPSKVIKGELREFSYKLLNILIQGSSADYTKQAMVRYDAARKTSRLLLNVHDEVVIMSPEEDVAQEMKILKEAMEGALPLDVPMLSAGETGYDWQNMEPYND